MVLTAANPPPAHTHTTTTTHKLRAHTQVLDDYPVPSEKQHIVKVVCPRGNNLHEAMWTDGRTALCSMPSKYRNRVWIKRGDFMIVEPIEEGEKVAAEIVNILLDKQIRHIKLLNLWPPEFLQTDRREERVAEEAKAGAAAGDAFPAANTRDADDDDAGDESGPAAPDAAVVAAAVAYGNDVPGVAGADVLHTDSSASEDDMSDLVPNNNRRYHEEELDDDETESEDEAGAL